MQAYEAIDLPPLTNVWLERELMTRLEECRERVIEMLEREDRFACGPAVALAVRPSKSIRPTLAFIAARAIEADAPAIIELAALIELVHVFSLIHDDIEDDARIRRGGPSVHARIGVPLAINVGDAVHALVWRRLSELPIPPYAVVSIARAFGDTLLRMVAGQARDLVWTRDAAARPTGAEYLAMIRGKTGALFGLSAAIAACVCRPELVPALRAFGDELGVAFQIADDLLDVVGDERELGKPVARAAGGGLSALLRESGAASQPDVLVRTGLRVVRATARRAVAHLDMLDSDAARPLVAFAEVVVDQLLQHVGA